MTAVAVHVIDPALPLLGQDAIGAAVARPSHAILIDENIRLRTENAVHLARQAADSELIRQATTKLIRHRIDAHAVDVRLQARELEIERRDERIAFLEAELARAGAQVSEFVR
jgi:hypothetical protein